MRYDPAVVKHQIDNMLLSHPELQDDDVLRADMVEGSTSAFEFLSQVVRLIGDNDALAKGVTIYIDELRARKERLFRRDQALRALIFQVMTLADLPKAELAEATVSIRAGQQKVIVTDETVLPDQFCRIKREPDKTAIKEALTHGDSVAGAQLSNGESTLMIRVK